MTKPILPRERDGDPDERERLLRRTKDALDAAEGGAGRHGAARNKDPITVYGAPPIPDDRDRMPAPVYGGPAMWDAVVSAERRRKRLRVMLWVGAALLTAAVLSRLLF